MDAKTSPAKETQASRSLARLEAGWVDPETLSPAEAEWWEKVALDAHRGVETAPPVYPSGE